MYQVKPSKFGSMDSLLNYAFIGSPPSGESLFIVSQCFQKPFQQKVDFLKALLDGDYLSIFAPFSKEYQILNPLLFQIRLWISNLDSPQQGSFLFLSCLKSVLQLFGFSLELENSVVFQHLSSLCGVSGYLFERELEERELFEMYFTLNEKPFIQEQLTFIKSGNHKIYLFHHAGINNMENTQSSGKFEFLQELKLDSIRDVCTFILLIYDFIGRRNNQNTDYLMKLADCAEVRPWKENKFGESNLISEFSLISTRPETSQTPSRTNNSIVKRHKMNSNKKVVFIDKSPQIESVLKDITNFRI